MVLPTPTVLGFADGFIPTGKTRYLFIPSVVDLSAPTTAEISAGTDLTKLVTTDPTGFGGTGSSIAYPNAFSRIVPTIPGTIALTDSTLTLNRDVAGVDASTLFSDGADGSTETSGVIGIADTGLAADTDPLQLFRVRCLSITPSRGLAAARTDDVMFSVSEIGPVTTVPNA